MRVRNEVIEFRFKESNEADIINNIRDEAENYFYNDIRKGKTLYFENWALDWNNKSGVIEYSLI